MISECGESESTPDVCISQIEKASNEQNELMNNGKNFRYFIEEETNILLRKRAII